MKCFDAEVSVERRNAIGGTSLAQVQHQLQEARRWLQQGINRATNHNQRKLNRQRMN
jgi:hypothetical protein